MLDNPQLFLWMDGEIVAWNNATIHVTKIGTSGVSSVFEGIRAYLNPESHKLFIFRLDEHLERFAQSISLLRMKQLFSNTQLRDGIIEVLRANKYSEDAYIRPLAFFDSLMFGGAAPDATARIVISSAPMPSQLMSGKLLHMCVSSWVRITDNVMPPRIKASSNYLNSRFASEEAQRNGYNSALILNPHGKVTESPGACVMIVREGKIITPSVTNGILESITRETLIHLCREVLNIEVIEREVDRTELYIASEAFLCATGAEIKPIASVDRFTLGDGNIGPITKKLVSLYHNLVRGIDLRFDEWRTQV